jgi:phage terminase small subunit
MKLATSPKKSHEKGTPKPAESASELEPSEGKAPSNPPRHLSRRMKAFWKSILATRKLEPHEEAIFLNACLSFDRAEAARKVLQQEGLTFNDRWGCPKARPEIAIEHDNRVVFAKLIKQLNLYLPEGWWPAGLR